MNDVVLQFIEAMRSDGCGPNDMAEIIADDEKRRYRLEDDNAGQKSAEYQLKIDDDFAVGWYRSYRLGEMFKWNSSSRKKYTVEEKLERQARIEAEQATKEILRIADAAEAARKAEVIWADASRHGESAYLTRKKITGLHGARIVGELLVVAAFKEGRISTIQHIAADGKKLFISDGEKSGAYFPIAAVGEDLSTIVLCEGFATGAAIREATELPVVVAFDAGNLKPVAKALRDKYPQARIVIAADNDEFTFHQKFRPKDVNPKDIPGDDPRWEEWRGLGYLYNTGVDKAAQAAVAIGGARVIIPRFFDVATRPTDINDLMVLDGLSAVKAAFDAPAPQEPEPTEEPPEWHSEIPPPENEDSQAQVALYTAHDQRAETVNWEAQLFYKDNGKIDSKSLGNCMLFLMHDKILSNLFCYDEFCCEKIVYQCPPWNKPEKFKPHAVTDNDVSSLTVYLEKRGIRIGTAMTAKMLDAAVRYNPRNPAQEYFAGLQWDGVKRLDTWLQVYCGATKEAGEYVTAIGRKWLCAIVKRVFEPGTKFDHMLILEGDQGIGKSTIFKELATIHGQAYFDDTIRVADIGTARVVPKLQGVLIVEIAELAGIRKHDVEELKAAITTTSDRTVLKYQNEPTTYPRKFVFAGTINPLDGYLSDPTGNRRFWPVTAKKIDIDGLVRVKEQLWAEALIAVRSGEKLYLDNALSDTASHIASERVLEHPWVQQLSKFTDGKLLVEKDELWTELEVRDRTKRTTVLSHEISKIMTKLGFKSTQKRIKGDRAYCWTREIEGEDIAL